MTFSRSSENTTRLPEPGERCAGRAFLSPSRTRVVGLQLEAACPHPPRSPAVSHFLCVALKCATASRRGSDLGTPMASPAQFLEASQCSGGKPRGLGVKGAGPPGSQSEPPSPSPLGPCPPRLCPRAACSPSRGHLRSGDREAVRPGPAWLGTQTWPLLANPLPAGALSAPLLRSPALGSVA